MNCDIGIIVESQCNSMFPCYDEPNGRCLNYFGNTLQQKLQNEQILVKTINDNYDYYSKAVDIEPVFENIISKLECRERGNFCQIDKKHRTFCKDKYIYDKYMKECIYGFIYYRTGEAVLHNDFGYDDDDVVDFIYTQINTSEDLLEKSEYLDNFAREEVGFGTISGESIFEEDFFYELLKEFYINNDESFNFNFTDFYQFVTELEHDLIEFKKKVIKLFPESQIIDGLGCNEEFKILELLELPSPNKKALQEINEEAFRIIKKYKLDLSARYSGIGLFRLNENHTLRFDDLIYEYILNQDDGEEIRKKLNDLDIISKVSEEEYEDKEGLLLFIFLYTQFYMDLTMENIHEVVNRRMGRKDYLNDRDNDNYLLYDRLYNDLVLYIIHNDDKYKVGDVVLLISSDEASPEKGIRLIGYEQGEKTIDKMSRDGVVFNKLRKNKVIYDIVSTGLSQVMDDRYIWLPKICQDIMNRPPHNAPDDFYYEPFVPRSILARSP